jgi:hypothetical protein
MVIGRFNDFLKPKELAIASESKHFSFKQRVPFTARHDNQMIYVGSQSEGEAFEWTIPRIGISSSEARLIWCKLTSLGPIA